MMATLAELTKRHGGIGLIVAAFVALGVVYSVVTPIFEASDELWHYPFVRHLAQGHGLPVQDPANVGPWRQEGSQPPLYYALGALATFWIEADDLPRINPHARIGDPLPLGNKNMVVHSPEESFPWRGTALAVHLIRLLSVLMGAATVFLVYRIALELFPERRALALGAAAIAAFTPMFLFIAGSVNNDNLVTPLCSLALLLIIRLVRNLQFAIRDWALLGLVLGLAALSKVSALGLFPLAALAIALAAWRRHPPLQPSPHAARARVGAFLRGCLVVFGLAGLVAGWWYLRNLLLYGEPTGLRMMVAIAGPRHPVPTLRQLAGEWAGFVMSYWGFFGGMNVPADPWFYRILNLIALLGLAGLGILALRWLRGGVRPSAPRLLGLGFLLAWLLIEFVGLVRWTLMTIASQGRLLFPAIASISILLALGLAELVPRRWEGAAMAVVGGTMFALALMAPFRYIAPAYARPSPQEGINIPHQLEANFEGKLALLGYDVEEAAVRPGEIVRLTLYWRALEPLEKDYSVFVHLLDENDLIVGQVDTYPGLGNFPFTQWPLGKVVADVYPVPISPTAYAPSKARWEVGVYDHATGERLRVLEPTPRDNVRFGEVSVLPLPGPFPNPVRFNFEDRIALVGYELDRRAARPGEALHLTLYWEALAEMEENYTVFTHVLGEGARIWAQRDSWPQGGRLPTSAWHRGQIVEDHYELVLDPETPIGVYELEIGWYLAETGRRLRVLGKGGFVESDRVLLSRVRVVP